MFGRVTIESWSWQQLEGPEVTLRDAAARETTFTAPTASTLLVFELTATDSEGREYTDRISLAVVDKVVDRDGNGLIEIDSLLMLHNMRHELRGTSYKTSTNSVGNSLGCPDALCRGYELTRNLDFDFDGDGSTWSGNGDLGYSLDSGDSQAGYFPVDGDGAGGWLPIGDGTSPFVAVFDGNGHRISNLAIRRDQSYIGLFGTIGNRATIRNLGLVDNLADYTGSSYSFIFIGGLVGLQQQGSSITASYATGDADGGAGSSDRVGGLVGQQEGGSITASYATGDADGGAGSSDRVGGLVGQQEGGSITASYAAGDADGGNAAYDHVGGLVGFQTGGSITASYATGDADGGDGSFDSVGGLVGQQYQGSITASYATGDADGGDRDNDRVGGLVGYQDGGSITASYATGDADGGGDNDNVGGLVGYQNQGSITASYGFGGTIGGAPVGSDSSTKPQGVSTAAQLTADNAGSAWNSAANNTLGAWDFGTDEQIPALNYADYDGSSTVFDCSQFPANACGTSTPTLLPGQDEASASGPSAVAFGATTTITGSLVFGRVAIESWSWVQLQGPTVTLMGADSRTATFRAPATGDILLFELTATDSGGDQYTDRILLSLGASVDQDGDGLIEIDSLTMLHNMRYNRAGTSYKESASAPGAAYGCPAARCRGYELTRNLDFDGDGDGSTWSGNAEDGFTLNLEDHEANYFPVDVDGAGGWLPIGNEANPFVAVFDGKGHTISNLAIRRDQTYIGLFGVTVGGIRNLGLVDNLADYTGSSDNLISIGGLVGLQQGGSITASYTTGDADGGDGDNDRVGGLVGRQEEGSSITASYATGDTDGGVGDDTVGGLVGSQQFGNSITASYATGAVAGGDGNNDRVGGLVGTQRGSITASYATGDADGGDGDDDRVGELVGIQGGLSSITASYGFGGTIGGGSLSSFNGVSVEPDGSTKPQGVSTAVQLTAANAGSAWNSAESNTLGAWDFGTDEQIPALNYADYDGIGTVFDCSQFPAGACETQLPLHAEVNATGLSTVAFGATTTITGSLVFGRAAIVSWSWEQLQGPNVTLIDANTRTATFRAPATGDLLLFELTATDSGGDQYTDRILLSLGASVDHDGDGLIEIDSLTMLHNMRHNLAGTSYKESASAPGAAYGCPAARCRGYELTRNLDFDVDGDGSTWSGNAKDGFTLNLEDHEANYFPVDGDGAGGWLPIGDANDPFVAVFDGNGHKISNLAIRRDQRYIGLFGGTRRGAAIRNLGLVDNLANYTGSRGNVIYIGGLVGWQGTGSSITASYATGDADGGGGGNDRVGGLVGLSRGSITASYATGDADGGDGGHNRVGGLVGLSYGSITASYATGDADGGDGAYDRVGGLVGWQHGGSITASYATGDADGGDGDDDLVGGLVGWQQGGSITASYATGDADGGDGDDDLVGGLVGYPVGGSITASYGFGGTISGGYLVAVNGVSVEPDGSTKPPRVSTAAQLTEANAGSAWNDADSNTLGAWDFGTDEQIPALNYADYDGPGTVFDCSQFPANACGTPTPTLLPGQDEASASGPSAGAFGATTTITGSLVLGRAAIVSWSWEQLQGPNVTLMGAESRTATFRAPATGTLLLFELTATDSGGYQYTDRILLSLGASVDHDGDGLIEIDSLTMLHNMRYNLAGTRYKESASALGAAYGCPAAGCRGYELTRNLDFDVDGDGSTWSGNAEDGFTLDSEDSEADYFPVDGDGAGGWLPIGNGTSPFVAVFDGNGHRISNLAIRRDQSYIGLFGTIGNRAAIRNLGLVDNLADYTGSFGYNYIGGLVGRQRGSITASYATGAAAGGVGYDAVGGLVGWQQGGSITASYATGDADGGDGDDDRVGGLVGRSEGSITASYATGDADGGDGDYDDVGGLVGYQYEGSITASYATGDADGGDGYQDEVGGLVGYQSQGSITASYATGDADGGDGDHDRVGGLVGRQKEGSSITASYATGDADGGNGDSDRVGGLVGWQSRGSITASYATGDAHGGVGNFDSVGGLVGRQNRASITASYATGDAHGGVGNFDSVGGLVGRQNRGSITAYGFGRTIGGESVGSDGSTKPQGVSTAAELTAANAGSAWNSAESNTLGAWDFGTNEQIPALNYADYDGPGTVFDCSQFPANACGTPTPTLLPGQDEASASGPSAAGHGETVSLAGSLLFGRVTIVSWSWRQLEGLEVTLSDADARETTFTAPTTSTLLVFELTATDSEGRQHIDRISLAVVVDRDGDGLIEIDSLLMLHNMRHNLAGTSYRTNTNSVGDDSGCPETGCIGYELMRDLDFDVNGDGSTWSGNAEDGFTLDLEDSEADYFPVASDGTGGWLPIGDGTNPFVAVFDGNTHRISNLAIRRDQTYVGLFGVTGSGSAIRNLGLVDNLADYTGSKDKLISIGGLVGLQGTGSSITASYATGDADGGDGNTDYVGGLVGWQEGGSITASYATGDADGGDGDDDRAGGLVGYQSQGSITASYATGDADGGVGDFDSVGGLVGWQYQGSITASYATGDADGGDGAYDRVGGLVGYQYQGSITASYATGDADGGDGDNDRVGGLVGYQYQGSITASYGFGRTIGGESVGSDGSTKPQGVSTAAQLTAANAGSAWNSAANNTLGAWDFGTDVQIPALNYADYDGTGTVFDCSQFPANACDTLTPTLLPGQDEASASGPSAAGHGETVSLAGSLLFGRVTIVSWSWRQLEGLEVTLSDADARETTFTAPTASTLLVFELTATDSEGRQHIDRISLAVVVDRDSNGLIEIDSLLMLHNMRHNLAGTSYKTSTASVGNSSGCPATGCIGYELTRNLDFDVDGDGSTYSGNAEDGFTLDEGDSRGDYFPVAGDDAGGWLPIGGGTDTFVAVFDGNGHKISNLAIRRDQRYIGLFGGTGRGAAIRNLGLVDNLADYTGSSYSGNFIGGLVGYQSQGSITASYATGAVAGGDGGNDRVGGLVGESQGSITASYATGDADGGDGDSDFVGGLVGWQDGGSITASYAAGDADGEDGHEDIVGGLVGWQDNGSSITASYATGDADGGDGVSDRVGGLVGLQLGSSTITASYGFGRTIGGESVGSDGSTKTQGVSTAAQLTAANAGSAWNDADSNTLGAWNFGANTQVPVLNYADYDGPGTVFDCRQFPAGVCGTLLPSQLYVSLTLEGAATVAEGTRVTLSAGLSSVIANETVVRLVVVAGGPGTADDADIVIEGDEFRVTIAAGVARGTTTFTVLDDDIDEEDEILMIDIAGDDLIADQIIEVTILDNDTRGVEISATSLNLTEGESGSYTVVLTSQPNTGSVTVIAASSDPTRVHIVDITAGSMPSDLVFLTENWDIPRIVQIITFPDPDGTDTDVEITHRVVADVGGDYADVKAADVVVMVEEGADPVFELEETISIAVFLEKSIPVKLFLDGSGERSSPTVVVLEAPDDLVVKFDKDAGDYGEITLRRFLNTGKDRERGRTVTLAVLGAQGGRTEVTLDIERLAPLPEIKISGEIIGIEPNLLLFTLGEARSLAASLKGGPIAGVMWRAEVSKGDSVAVDAIGESGSFTLSASSLKTGQSELTLTAFDDNGRRREQSFPVVVAAAEAKPRLKLSVSTRIDGFAEPAIVSGFAVDDDILIKATLEGAVPSLEQLGAAVGSIATVSFRITVAKLGADGTPEGRSVILTATATVGGNAPALRIEPVPVGTQTMAVLSLEVGDLVRVSIGHLVATEASAGEVSAREVSAREVSAREVSAREVSDRVIAGDALLLQVLATAMVDSDNDGLSDTVGGESEPDTLGPITAAVVPAVVEEADGGVSLPEAVSLSLSLGDLARSLGLGGCGGVSLTLTLGADDELAGCGDADPISLLAIKTLTMTAQERFGEGDYQLFDFLATFDSSEIGPDGLLVINLPVDPETHRVYRFDSDSNEWVLVIDAGLPNQPATGSLGALNSIEGNSGVLNSIEGSPGALDSLEDDCKTCFYALDFDRDGSVELLLLLVPVDPEAPSFEVVDTDFQDRWFSIDAKETTTILLRGRGLGGLTTTVTIVENDNVRGRYIQAATIGGIVGPAVELYGLRRTRNGPVAVLVEALGEHGEAVAGITFDVAVRNRDPMIKFRLSSGSGEEITSLKLPKNTEIELEVIIADPDGDTEFDLALTSGGDFAILKPGPNPNAAVGTPGGGDGGGDVVINRLILTSGDDARIPFTLTFEATDRSDKSKSLESLTVCVLGASRTKCPTPPPVDTDPIDPVPDPGDSEDDGGGGGSLGLWALVALALAHPLGMLRRRPPSFPRLIHLPDSGARCAADTENCTGRPLRRKRHIAIVDLRQRIFVFYAKYTTNSKINFVPFIITLIFSAT